MSYRRVLTATVVIALIVFAASHIRRTQADSTELNLSEMDVFADNPQQSIASGFDFSNIDRSVSACQDFNQFANGGWKARTSLVDGIDLTIEAFQRAQINRA